MRGWLKRLLGASPSADEFVITEAGDLESAIAEARRTLPVFWRKFDIKDGEDFQVKAGLTTPNGAVEHIWLAPSARTEENVTGCLTNEPVDLDDVSLGDEVVVDSARISDWSYWKDGFLYGSFTQRASVGSLSRDMRRQFEAILPPTPLEIDPA